MNPYVKILRPELVSSAAKMHVLGSNAVVKLFDKYFQDSFDVQMNRFEVGRKNTGVTLSMYEDFVNDP
jgi:hypothetical protein